MTHTSIVASPSRQPRSSRACSLGLVLCIAACGKAKTESSSAEPLAVTAEAQPPGPPFTGQLTAELVLAGKGIVQPLQPWDDAFARLQAKVGKPTKVDNHKYIWAAMQGDDCAYFYVEQEDGKQYQKPGMVVGGVSEPKKYGKADAIMNRGECLEALGKGAAPEDPNAPAPPEGKSVAVGFVLDNAVKARSKWEGKQLTVEAIHQGIGGTSVMLKDRGKGDKHDTLTCDVGTGDTREPLMGKPIVARGTLKIDHLVSGTGEPSLRASLDHCTISEK